MTSMPISATATASPSSTNSWVVRFTRTERLVHWVQAVSFLTLLATGLILGTSALESIVGNRALLREIHLITAFVFVFGPALIALAGNRQAVAADAEDVDEWSEDDVRWLLRPGLEPKEDTPPAGKFNAGQKLNAIFVVYSTWAFALTGLIIWQNRRFPFSVVAQANTIHTDLAYIALAVFLGHLYLAAFHRATRHALHGILFGTVRSDWARQHHTRWHFPAAAEAPLRPLPVAGSIVLFALGAMCALLLVRFLLEALGANTTDAITLWVYHVTALPGTVGAHTTGVHSFDLAALVWAGLAASVWKGFRRGETLLPGLGS